MTIESIELKNYRNYEELHMELSQGTNILYGDNAQGKTNILEAVYVCCTTKSHRGAKDRKIKVITSNLGCHVLSVFTKDREGNFGDVVLGFENVEDCWHGDGSYMGAIAGRVANRIGDAKFELNGKTYELAANNGKNSLHGGIKGFNQKIFKYELLEDGIRFIYLSPDMEEGYPGSLYLKVVYRLCDNTLKMEYEAVSDQDTLINITNHYFIHTYTRRKVNTFTAFLVTIHWIIIFITSTVIR